MKKYLIVAALLASAVALAEAGAGAQELSLSTNIADYARTGTANVEASYGFSRHWSVNAGVKYDPLGQYRQQLYSLGSRYWPWHIYSGWWMCAKVQYQEFNESESVTLVTSEGDRYGAGLSAGYSKMLGKHFNIDVGAGLWTGYSKYTSYACPTCGRVTGSGDGTFLLPHDIIFALSYIF